MSASEFFLEVRSEEIPARMLRPAVRELATRLFEDLLGNGLTPAEVQTGFTPRRLVVALKGVPEKEPDREEMMTGPPAKIAFDDQGEPTAAALGFAKKVGVEPAALEVMSTSKGDYLSATRSVVGRAAPVVLTEIVPSILRDLSWAKSMRWAIATGPWVRPVHSIVALFDGKVVPFELFGVSSGKTTLGHPVHSPREFEVRSYADYRRKMTRRGIEVRFEERRRQLRDQMLEQAAILGGDLVEDAELLDKLASICGIPGVVAGSFDAKYLALPREVLITSLRDHQSAFTVESAGHLVPGFLTVMDRSDDPDGRVQAGNEWVVAARLDDARFFYSEDRKVTLDDRAAELENLTFHARLGSYADKVDRLVELTAFLCEAFDWHDVAEESSRAARLLKIDLTTEVVKEFTSLQGVMGGVYAREEDYPEEIWQAIYDQYLPASSDDGIPRSRTGLVTAIADRVDTLVGMFGLGLVPSGSRDPFGLRRAAQGLVRIVLEAELPLDLDLVAARCARLYGDRLELGGEAVSATLRPFIYDRLRHLLGRQGYAYDSIEAALAAGVSHLPNLRKRVDALHRVRSEPGFLAVVLAAKRIANILRQAPEHELRSELLKEPAEQSLFEATEKLRGQIDEAQAVGDFEQSLHRIAEMAGVLDRFFVEVLVMDEDQELRNNRLALLQSIQRSISRTARLTEVVVDRTEHREKVSTEPQD